MLNVCGLTILYPMLVIFLDEAELAVIRKESSKSHWCHLNKRLIRHTLNNIVFCSRCMHYIDKGKIWCELLL